MICLECGIYNGCSCYEVRGKKKHDFHLKERAKEKKDWEAWLLEDDNTN